MPYIQKLYKWYYWNWWMQSCDFDTNMEYIYIYTVEEIPLFTWQPPPPPPTHTQMHSSLNCRVIIFYQVKLTQQYIGASFIKLFFNVDLKLTIHISSWANLYWLLLIIQSYYYCQLSPTSQQSFFFSSAELCLKAKPKLSWS